jgi:hypothetical protein
MFMLSATAFTAPLEKTYQLRQGFGDILFTFADLKL